MNGGVWRLSVFGTRTLVHFLIPALIARRPLGSEHWAGESGVNYTLALQGIPIVGEHG
jgi:hypothetical protein